MFLSMIKVAEARGGVPETLRMMAHHFENRQRLIRQARSAMIYPVIVLAIASIVVALVTIFLLPKFAMLLKDIAGNVQLPLASRVLMGISHFRAGHRLVADSGRHGRDAVRTDPRLQDQRRQGRHGPIALRLPGLRQAVPDARYSRFARTLSVLLDAGVDLGNSIDLTADVMVMQPIRRAVRSSREQIMAGKELSATLDRTRQFTPDVIAVISSGEETGKLPESLAHLADDYDEQISVMVASLSHLVQPLMIVLIGGIVFFIILAVFMPIIQLITTLAAPP